MPRSAFTLLICFLGTGIFGQDAKLIYKNAVNSTVTIETDKGLGSGFFIGKNIIATNYHVIEGATIANCYTNNSDIKYNIEGFLAIDTSADLILLKVKGLDRVALKVASKSIVTGQKIFVLGSPKGLPATISDGIISGLRNINGHRYIQITAPISSGSSGGPVLNGNGELVGISSGQIQSGQNLNFAIPTSYLQALLKSKLSIPTLLAKQPAKTSSFNKVKQHIVYYENGIITQEIIQNYFSFSEEKKTIQNKILGNNVEIIIDTIFKKYTILFTDKDDDNIGMIFNYQRRYFPDSKEENQKRNKLYLMEYGDSGGYFFLQDYLETLPFNELVIIDEVGLANNCTLLYRIKNAKKTDVAPNIKVTQ